MLQSLPKYPIAVVCLVSIFSFAQETEHRSTVTRTVLLEVIRNSWDAQRNETLLYLRVYSDGFAETDPMRHVDFRNIQPQHKQLSSDELSALQSVLSDPATGQLLPEYDKYWGNKDFGYRFDVTIFASAHEQRLTLVNFQPFLARKKASPYPREVEKLGCAIWRLRVRVSGEPLDKDWLAGCAKIGY